MTCIRHMMRTHDYGRKHGSCVGWDDCGVCTENRMHRYKTKREERNGNRKRNKKIKKRKRKKKVKAEQCGR